MRCLIIYFSQAGSTKQVSMAIGAGLKSAGCQVDYQDITRVDPKERTEDLSKYDLLGIGSPVYYYSIPLRALEYLEHSLEFNQKPVFTFLVNGSYAFDAVSVFKKQLKRKNALHIGHFSSLGKDYFLPYLKQGYFFSPSHPTKNELRQAELFGQKAVEAALKRSPLVVSFVRIPWIYRLERFVFNGWMIKNVYSGRFKVNKDKCTRCGLCQKICPVNGVKASVGELPEWSRDCMLCLDCEMKCPKEAITSPLDWLFFRIFVRYNVRHAALDKSLDRTRISFKNGRWVEM
jgi:flavodoxin/NAD-dependent dihydropyrimidine dehydrogenase PreA subunit